MSAEEQKKEKAEANSTTAEAFITDSALYTPVRVDGFHPPTEISFECPGACAKETTWSRLWEAQPLGQTQQSQLIDWKLKSIAYRCVRCKETVLTLVYREMQEEERILPSRPSTGLTKASPAPPTKTTMVSGVMKVGQYPAPSIKLPKGLEKGLEKNATILYRKALVNRNFGQGLGAVSYVRRVVEDKTNELIEVAA